MFKKNKIIFFIFLGLLFLGVLFGYLYYISPRHVIHLKEFQTVLNSKEKEAAFTISEMIEAVCDENLDTLLNITYNDQDISYYIFEDDELIFWSGNHLDISGLNAFDFMELHYIELPNAHCAVLSRSQGEKNFIALITIKYNYPYETDKLINRFTSGFNTHPHIDIQVGLEADDYPVYCTNGYYMFSLKESDTPLYNDSFAYISAIAYLLVFVFFFILYFRFPTILKKKTIPIRAFLLMFIFVGLFVSTLLYFNIPGTLFKNSFFTSFEYASLGILSSLAHLIVFTLYVAFSVCLFFFYVKLPNELKSRRSIFLLILYPAFFILLYFVLWSLVFHSSIRLNIFHLTDFTFIGILAHILIFIWGVCLVLIFFKTHSYFLRKKNIRKVITYDSVFLLLLLLISLFINDFKTHLFIISYFILTLSCYFSYFLRKIKYRYIYLMILGATYAFLVVWNLFELSVEKNTQKYKVLAQNIYINGNLKNDPVAEIMLDDLNNRLMNDSLFLKMIHEEAFLDEMQEYLNRTHFHGFWSKYDIQLDKIEKASPFYENYMYYINNGNLIEGTYFYSIPTIENAMTYLGLFQINEDSTSSYFMRFYPRREYRSYSFPDLLIPSSVNMQTQLNVSIAKYDNGSLTYSSGSVEYPLNGSWVLEKYDSDCKLAFFENHLHYIYNANANTYIVITEQRYDEFSSYLQFFFYLFLAYFVLSWLAIRFYQIAKKDRYFNIGLTSRFQFAFILLLIVSFVTIFYVSVNFIKHRYEKQQKITLENKKNYIQHSLQDLYYFNQELNEYDVSDLYVDLLELSYIYQTDIHVFDNDGLLVCSSLPLIFNRHLISDRISPIPYFSQNIDIELYEHIGELDYLVAYTDFYNGDYLQIGYIAIPFYFSQKEMQQEIESFASVIVHIYLIIIILTILLTLIIGKRLSAPLNMLEKKLKQMRLGQRNEKIEYKLNDEIGQLVAQYNQTVDELEQSVDLLARSEREAAWRTMARQIAHEINNPLTPMKLSIQQLQRRKGMDDKDFDEYFDRSTEMFIEQIDNLSRIASTFSDFARMPEAKYEYVNITSILKSVIELFVNNMEKVEIRYIGTEEDIFIYADSEQLLQVFNNIIKNGIQSIPTDRHGVVKVDLYEKSDNVFICVHDNGNGIPKEIQDKLFMPNFTTKNQGMGLGLAISKNIIQQLGGYITFKTKQNIGTTFIVKIPIKKTI